MEIRAELSDRINRHRIAILILSLQESETLIDELMTLCNDQDDRIAANALWVCSHFPQSLQHHIAKRYDEFTSRIVSATNPTIIRLSLACLESLPADFRLPPCIALFDWCLTCIPSESYPNGVRAISIKIAYRISCSYPELMKELHELLSMIQPMLTAPSLISACRNTLKRIDFKTSKPGMLLYHTRL